MSVIRIEGANEHNLQNLDIQIPRQQITVITGVSGSGKSTLAFDTLLQESQRRFFYTLSHYTRQFLDLGTRPKVRKMTGLSPAIGLTQNETFPSRKATLASLTDLNELMGVMFARFGERLCPQHGVSTQGSRADQIVSHMMELDAVYVALFAPLVTQRKGIFSKELTQWREKGFLQAWIDGRFVDLSQEIELEKEKKHTIKLLIDVIRIQPKSQARLLRSVEHTLEAGHGHGEYVGLSSADLQKCAPEKATRFSTSDGCPLCAYSWPELDPRYFSANSLGQCKSCGGYGSGRISEEEETIESDGVEESETVACHACEGSGLDASLHHIHLKGHSILAWYAWSCAELREEIARLQIHYTTHPAPTRVLEEIASILQRICHLDLGYLQPQRRVRSLSLGEHQRLNLAGILSETLRGVLYVLDEPSQGLHPHQLAHLWQTFVALKESGNTVVIVDHDDFLIQQADHVIDMGPGGGKKGGQVLYAGAPIRLAELNAVKTPQPVVIPDAGELEIRGATLHNLQVDSVRFPLGAISVVTGVSGAGKSSLVLQTLVPNLQAACQGTRAPTWKHCKQVVGWKEIETVEVIDRKLLHKSSLSTPATYFDIFILIRDLFAKGVEAQLLGLTPRHFSLHGEGGRCEACKGKGVITHTMRFLAETRTPCTLCGGRRFKEYLDQVRYRDASIADVLQMTLEEALAFFANHRKISQRLQPAIDLGLGYLSLGQPTTSLSGGEIQRMKLVPFFAKRTVERTLFVLDEPTRGLHNRDIEPLMACLRALVQKGGSVILLEHHVGVMRGCDWLVDLGPGAAHEGGQVLYQGAPLGVKKVKASLTGRYL